MSRMKPNVRARLTSLTNDVVERFTVKVAPLPSVPAESAKPKPLSAASAEHLRKAAKSLSDPELRALYLHLASFAVDDST